jgi:hypothetical protein
MMKIVVALSFDAGDESLALMREVARVTVLDGEIPKNLVNRGVLRGADGVVSQQGGEK